MRVAILVLLLPALVLAYPYPQRSSEGVSRPSRGKQRFNIEELPASASDVEPTLSLSRRGSSQRRSGYESQREPETASSVVAPVTQQLLSSRTSSQRRGNVSATQATDDKFRSRSSFNRRTPSSQETVDRGFPSRRRESITETTPVPYKSPQVEQATLESNKENYPTPSVDIVRNPPPSETPAPIASSSSLPQPSNPTGITRRRTSNRHSDTTVTELSPRNSFPASDTLNERPTRFESSRRRQPSDIGQDTSASEGRRNGRRNLSRGTARANSADINTNSVTSTQEFSNKSRNSGRRESTSARRSENNISSSPVSFPSRSRSSSTQSRPSKENENINNDIPVHEIPDDPSLIASKRMDTIDDTSEEPVTPEFTESISSEPESSSVSTEENLASSSELPSTPDYSESTPKPLDILQSNRRKSSATRSQSNSRDSVSNDRNPKSRSQTITPKAGINTNSRRGSARTSRVNDNNADYSTNSNVGYDETFNVNAVNYRRDSSVISSNTEQFSQRSVINSRRNQPSTRGRTEESEASASGPSARVSLRRNWESSKSSNDINANVGTPTASVPSPRVNNSRRSSSSDTNRRLTGNERRGSRGYNADNPEPYVEETSTRRGSRTRSNATTRTELNSVDSVRPIARSGRRTSEPDVIATATAATTATTAQRTSRRTSPDVGRRGSVKDSSTARNSSKPKKTVIEDEDIDESENYPAVFLKALKALKSEKTEKAVPDSDGNGKVANTLEIRKRGNIKVSEKKADEPIVLKEKTRKVSLLLAPSPPSENIEQDSRHQSNDILLPREQDKSKNIQQDIIKTSDETTESITFSRNSGRRPSKSDTIYPGSTTITKTRTGLKSTRPQTRIRQIDAAVSKAPEALHQIISPTATPAYRSTSKFGSNIHPDLDLSSAKAVEISSSVSPISHEYPLSTESYLSDISSGKRTSEDTNTNSDLSTSTKKSGYHPRARSLYKTSTVPPAPETSSKNSYSSRTRSSTPRPSLPKGTSSYKRRTSSTTPENVLETTPQSAFIQSPIAPPSPHRFSARYRNDLLRVTGALRVTTTPAYVPTVPTVSTTTSTTSTTDSPYVENSSEALTLDASSLTLDATSLTLTDVDTDISLDSLEVAHSLKELNEIYPSSTEIDLPTLPNVLQNIDPPTSSSTVRTPSSTFTSLPEDEQSTTAASIKTKIVTEAPSKVILKTTPTRSVTSTISPPTTEIIELEVTTLPTVAVAIKTTKIPKIITTPSATTSEARSMTTTLKTTASPTSTTTPKPTTSTTLKISTVATAKPSKPTKIPKVITTPSATTSEARSMTTTLKTTASPTSTTTPKPTTSTTLKINTIAAAKPTTTPKATAASTVPNESSTVKSSKIFSTTIPTTVTPKTTEHTTSRKSASVTTTLVPSSSTFATVRARNNTSLFDSDSKENDLVSHVAQKESSDFTSELETPPRKKSVSTATPPPVLPFTTTTVPSGRFPTRLTVAPRGAILSTTTIPPPPQFEHGMNLEVFSSGEPSIYNPPSPVRFIYTQPPPTTRRTPAPYVIFGIFPNNTIFRKFPDSDIKEIVSENEISRPQSYYPDEYHTSSKANNFDTSTQQPQRFANMNNFHGTNQQEYAKQDVQNTALYSLHHTGENEVLRTNAATFAAGSSEPNVPAQISVGTSQPVLTETSTISSSTRPFPESAQDVKQVPPVIVQTPIEFSNSVYNGQDNKYKNFWSSTSTKKPEFRILTTDIPSTTPASVSSTSVFIVTPEPPTTTSTTTEVFRWKPTSPPSTVEVQHGTADVTTAPHLSVTTATPAASVTPTAKVTTNAVTRASTTTTTTTTKKPVTKAETTTQPTFGLRGLISRVLGNIPTSPITSSTSEATPVTTASVSTAKPTTIAPQPTPIPNAATTAKRDIATSNNSGSGISTTVKPVITTKPSTTSKPPTTSIKPPSTSLKPLTSTTTTTTTTTTKKPTQTTTVKLTPPPTTTKKPTTPATTTKKPTTPTKKPVTTTKKPIVTTTTKRPTSTATTTKKPASTTTTKKPVPTTTTTKRPTTTIATTTKKLPATTSTTKRPTTTITTTTTTTRKVPTTVTTTTTKRPSTTTSPKPPTTSLTSPSPVSATTARSNTPTTTTVIPAATSPKTASTLSKGFPANSFGDFAFLNSLLGGQQENKKRPGRERTGDLANKVIEIAIQRASTSTTTSHPTLTTKDSQLNFPGIMEQEEYEDRPRTSRDKDNNMANKVIEVAVQRASTSTAAPIAPLSSDETNTSPRKLSPDEQLLAALLNSQSRGPSTPPPRPKTTVASKLSPDEQFLAALLESQLKAAITPKPKTQTPAPKKLSPDEQFLAALLKSQLGGASTSKPKPQVTSTKLTDDQLLAALLGGAQAGGSSRSKTPTRLTASASASAAPAAAQSPALLGGLLGQLGGRNTLPDPATLPTDEDDVDSPRGQRLVKAAIDVTKAVSQFMNVVIQGASERFQTFFRSGTSLLSNYFSWGSSQAGNFS